MKNETWVEISAKQSIDVIECQKRGDEMITIKTPTCNLIIFIDDIKLIADATTKF